MIISNTPFTRAKNLYHILIFVNHFGIKDNWVKGLFKIVSIGNFHCYKYNKKHSKFLNSEVNQSLRNIDIYCQNW